MTDYCCMLSMSQIPIKSVVLSYNHQARIFSLTAYPIFPISTALNFGSKLAWKTVSVIVQFTTYPKSLTITGCDSTSALAGIGKKKGWQVLLRNEQHQGSLGPLGSQRNLSDGVATQCEAFIWDLCQISRMKSRTVNELRYFLYWQNRTQKNELLSPISDSPRQHFKRVNYQTFVWRKAPTAIQHLPQPESNGWVRDDP